MLYKIDEILKEYPAYSMAIKIFILFISAYITDIIVRKYFIDAVKKFTDKTKNTWDDKFYDNKVFNKLANLIPAIVIYNFTFIFGQAEEMVSRIVLSYMIYGGVLFFNAVLDSFNSIYTSYPFSKHKPIKGYMQIVKLLAYIIGILTIISVLINKSPVILLSGIGAMMAVILLIFKDTILSLVASVQIRTNNLIMIGDWITMPKYNADGDVIDMALHTIKVQNFDKTITTIPTHKVLDESFQNWRGMTESAGRRIKRSVNIDMESIRFLKDSDIDKFRKVKVLKDYIDSKLEEINDHNEKIQEKNYVNMRNLTNIGTFRIYLKNYLSQRPDINQEMTFLIRHLAPGPEGLPVEVYVFAKDNRWAYYEEIQADIFDHILAVIKEFDLRLYQRPTGSDITALRETLK